MDRLQLGAPGGGKFIPSYLDFSSGMLRIKVTQTYTSTGGIRQNPGTLWWTTWAGLTRKQWTSRQAPFAPEKGFHSYRCVWTRTAIRFYVDNVLVSSYTGVVPANPAYAMINHWGTNRRGWGGLATTNITRYMFVRSFSFVPIQ